MANYWADEKKTTLQWVGHNLTINPTSHMVTHNWEKTQNLELLPEEKRV